MPETIINSRATTHDVVGQCFEYKLCYCPILIENLQASYLRWCLYYIFPMQLSFMKGVKFKFN